ncbi:ComEA family DNA-binding protein, partial [Desulfomarina sp.]
MKTHQLFLGAVFLFTSTTLLTPAFSPATEPGKAASMLTNIASEAGLMEKININTASVDALSQIPGIGPQIGQAIAAYREAHGAFASVKDLANIDGIDASLLEKVMPL